MDKLANRLQNLPLILAGPVLRRVTDQSVSVWVALKSAATVTLKIRMDDLTSGKEIAASTPQPTIKIGAALHIVVVTAQVSLVPEVVYTYDMVFQVFTP